MYTISHFDLHLNYCIFDPVIETTGIPFDLFVTNKFAAVMRHAVVVNQKLLCPFPIGNITCPISWIIVPAHCLF